MEKVLIKTEDIEITKEVYQSEFYNKLLQDELRGLLKEKDPKDNYVQMYKAYIYEDEENIDIGTYIINTSKREVILKNISVNIYYKGKLIKVISKNIDKSIDINKAIFEEFKIDKEEFKDIDNIDNIDISLSEIKNFKKYPYIVIDTDNMPKIKEYVNYRDIKKFIKNLPIIDEEQLTIDIFRIGSIDNRFYIIAIFRNSSNKDLTINSIPLTIYTNKDFLMYKGVFHAKEGSLLIPAQKGKIMTITLPEGDFPILEGEDLSSYKVQLI